MVRRFAIRYSPWLRPLFLVLGTGPRFSWVEVRDDALEVRMGWVFRCVVPRASIGAARRERDVWWAIGVHTDLRGRWLVNGSAKGIVAVDVEPAGGARLFGIPVKVRRLGLGLDDPDGFLAAVG